jgi:hypothetical protein
VPLLASATLVVLPLRQAERQAAALRDLEARIEQLEQRLATREQVLAQLRHLERLAELDPRLMRAETPAIAGATLAGKLTAFLSKVGGTVDSTRVLEPAPDPPLRRIGVRLQGAADLEGLRRFLRLIENAEPSMTIESLTIESEENVATAELVQIEITVVGYTRIGPDSEMTGERTTALMSTAN